MATELILLQQQVADLWRRFKAPGDTVMDDGTVTRLAARVAALERTRRALMDERAAVQLEVARHRRRAEGRQPAWRALGGLLGLAAVGGALWRWPEVLLVPLTDGPAALVLAGSLVVGGIALRRRR